MGLEKKEGGKPPVVKKQTGSFRREWDQAVDVKADDFIIDSSSTSSCRGLSHCYATDLPVLLLPMSFNQY